MNLNQLLLNHFVYIELLTLVDPDESIQLLVVILIQIISYLLN